MQGLRSLRLLARNAVNQTTRRQYHARYRSPTQNDMPKPEGDFFALHAERNRNYNIILATGVVMNGIGLYMLAFGDIVHFHTTPPATYE